MNTIKAFTIVYLAKILAFLIFPFSSIIIEDIGFERKVLKANFLNKTVKIMYSEYRNYWIGGKSGIIEKALSLIAHRQHSSFFEDIDTWGAFNLNELQVIFYPFALLRKTIKR